MQVLFAAAADKPPHVMRTHSAPNLLCRRFNWEPCLWPRAAK
jgi:hypothetical protein